MSAQINNRYIAKFEELEQIKEKLAQTSQRTRNISSDRQQTNGINVTEVKSSRNSEKQSQSVEKFLNLRQQNQNVDNLINSWKQQKTHSVSLNQGTIAGSIIQESPEHESPQTKPGTYPHLILEEDEQQQFLEQVSSVQPTIQNKGIAKVPITTKSTLKDQVNNEKKKSVVYSKDANMFSNTQQQAISQQNQNVIQKKNNTAVRPQTSKVQPQPTPSQIAQKKAVQSKQINMKMSQEIIADVPQTPSQQKMKQSSLLEKTRQVKMNQASNKVQTKSIQTNQGEEKILIQQIQKVKETILKLYEQKFDHQMSHSSSNIAKNFDQIVNAIKLDFRCLEND
ncbi:unnamed protein product [Paramecium primaurelia]|uniref:Uncharacterized protein n=1 Tax=Paramecium primaurelia TaxID=5886 RepID=A0A8S1JPE9_PARPR|nr:unnamed protein product [Paramecium primaurelia]